MRIRTDNQKKNYEKLRNKFLRLKAFEDAKIAVQVYEESVMIRIEDKNIIANEIAKEIIIQEPIYTCDEIKKLDIFTLPSPPLNLKRVRSRKIYYPYNLIEDEKKSELLL